MSSQYLLSLPLSCYEFYTFPGHNNWTNSLCTACIICVLLQNLLVGDCRRNASYGNVGVECDMLTVLLGGLRLSPRQNFNFACFCRREGTGNILERLALRLWDKEDDIKHEQDQQDDEHDERVLQQSRLQHTTHACYSCAASRYCPVLWLYFISLLSVLKSFNTTV